MRIWNARAERIEILYTVGETGSNAQFRQKVYIVKNNIEEIMRHPHMTRPVVSQQRLA